MIVIAPFRGTCVEYEFPLPLERQLGFDERQVRVKLTEQGRAVRAGTRALADALYTKSGMTEKQVADLNTRVKALRDTFRTS
jgi:DNA-binding MarR family transcriptional regulator